MQYWNSLQRWALIASAIFTGVSTASADCNSYSPAFPLPKLDPESEIIKQAQHDITSALQQIIQRQVFKTTSFSIAVTSSTETLFELHHTAADRDEDRPGAKVINGDTCYRIASCTKAFTVLTLLQQQNAGRLDLDEPINTYITELQEPQYSSLPWKDITLRILATQLSGIPRDMAQTDLIVELKDPVAHGLPPLSPSQHHETQCDQITNYTKPCTRADLLRHLQKSRPIFAPKAKSTYSNLNYEIIALALENITSTPIETLITESILQPQDMSSTSFTRPPDSVAALPKGESYYWDVIMGQQNPTGGLYSSSTDLAKFIRYILTHYNGLGPATNWLAPSSFATGMNTFTGMPWEIYRTASLLPYTSRPVTFVTKSGGLPGYTSLIVTVPDYNLGFTILVAGKPSLVRSAFKVIGTTMVRAADTIAQHTLRDKYTGTWTTASSSSSLNSIFTTSHTPTRGLYISHWISNGTNILAHLGAPFYFTGTDALAGENQYLQLVPTLLFKDEKNQKGEIWRAIGHVTRSTAGDIDRDEDDNEEGGYAGLFEDDKVGDDFCITDIDQGSYGGEPIGEVVFWDAGGEGFGEVELTAFRVRLGRVGEKGGEGGRLSVQEL